jgi:hypothetical protein
VNGGSIATLNHIVSPRSKEISENIGNIYSYHLKNMTTNLMSTDTKGYQKIMFDCCNKKNTY